MKSHVLNLQRLDMTCVSAIGKEIAQTLQMLIRMLLDATSRVFQTGTIKSDRHSGYMRLDVL